MMTPEQAVEAFGTSAPEKMTPDQACDCFGDWYVGKGSHLGDIHVWHRWMWSTFEDVLMATRGREDLAICFLDEDVS